MRAEYQKNATVNLRHFWLRRALRVLPPLYLVVLGSVLLALAVYPPGTVRSPAVASQLLFYANYYNGAPEVPGTRVIWSLAVEEHFYLLFPLLYVALAVIVCSDARHSVIDGATRKASGSAALGFIWAIGVHVERPGSPRLTAA